MHIQLLVDVPSVKAKPNLLGHNTLPHGVLPGIPALGKRCIGQPLLKTPI